MNIEKVIGKITDISMNIKRVTKTIALAIMVALLIKRVIFGFNRNEWKLVKRIINKLIHAEKLKEIYDKL